MLIVKALDVVGHSNDLFVDALECDDDNLFEFERF